jgi:N-acetylmuramoyl-L-alanine amidase
MINLVFLLSAALTAAPAVPAPLPIIALDPGHGGDQAGAHGVCGAWEKDVTLQIAKRVARVLEASGRARPLLTRDHDETLPLPLRSERALAARARLFLSIHANASVNPSARGVETFFLSLQPTERRLRRLAERENEGAGLAPARPGSPLALVLGGLRLDAAHVESQALAMSLQRAMVGHLHSRGRGVLQAPFMVLLGARMPAALVEVGFLTHPQECVRLTTDKGQEAIAEAIAAGVLAHLAVGRTVAAQGGATLPGA